MKDDCWLLPKPGSVEAAAHAAAVARHRQQQRQQAQQQQRSDSVTVAAAAVAADAHAVAAVAAASEAADNEGVIDLTHGSDDDAVDPTAAAKAGPDGFASPSKAALIDLTGMGGVYRVLCLLGSVVWHPLQSHNQSIGSHACHEPIHR